MAKLGRGPGGSGSGSCPSSTAGGGCERAFRRAILLVTLLGGGRAPGRPRPGRSAIRERVRDARWAVLRRIGLEPDRAEVDAYWRDRRDRREAATRAKYRALFARLTPERQAFLRVAGMGPDEAVVCWGNYDMTFVLSSKVFAATTRAASIASCRTSARSASGRSTCSTWTPASSSSPRPPRSSAPPRPPGRCPWPGRSSRRTPGAAAAPSPTPRRRSAGSCWATRSCRATSSATPTRPPSASAARSARSSARPSRSSTRASSATAPSRSITRSAPSPTASARGSSSSRRSSTTSARRTTVLSGEGDWVEPAYWLGKIQEYCRSKGIVCLFAPVPWEGQVTGQRNSGDYPARVATIAHAGGPFFCDATEAFVGEQLVIRREFERSGRTMPTRTPLYNGDLGDGHFSPRGCAALGTGRRRARRVPARSRSGPVGSQVARDPGGRRGDSP